MGAPRPQPDFGIDPPGHSPAGSVKHVEPRERSGFELSPHAADVTIHAWSSTVDSCLAEAVLGFVACFANIEAIQVPRRMISFECEPAAEPELLVQLLDTAIDVVDTRDAVPVQVTAMRTTEGGLTGEFGVVESSDVDIFGPAPKAVARDGLHVDHEDGSWRCRVVVTP